METRLSRRKYNICWLPLVSSRDCRLKLNPTLAKLIRPAQFRFLHVLETLIVILLKRSRGVFSWRNDLVPGMLQFRCLIGITPRCFVDIATDLVELIQRLDT